MSWSHAPVTFESPEEAFDLVSAPISYAIVWPRSQAFWIGRHDRFVAQLSGQFPRFITFVGTIHEKLAARRSWAASPEQFAPVRCVSGLSWGKLEHQGAPSIRGNQMNLGGAASTGASDRLPAVFFSAPVPSG